MGYTKVNIKYRNEQYKVKVKQIPSKFNHMLEAIKVSLSELVFTSMELIFLAILDPRIAGGKFLGSHVERLITRVHPRIRSLQVNSLARLHVSILLFSCLGFFYNSVYCSFLVCFSDS